MHSVTALGRRRSRMWPEFSGAVDSYSVGKGIICFFMKNKGTSSWSKVPLLNLILKNVNTLYIYILLLADSLWYFIPVFPLFSQSSTPRRFKFYAEHVFLYTYIWYMPWFFSSSVFIESTKLHKCNFGLI